MRELLQILQQAKKLSDADRSFALATVVKIGGSTYRRPGARMLVSDEGERWGALSGGCLEGEVAQQALEVIATGKPQLIPFDLAEDDIVLGFGTGCNGIVHVLIQPLRPHQQSSVVEALRYCVVERKTCLMATVIDASPAAEIALGNHLIVAEDGTLGPSTIPTTFAADIIDQSERFLAEEVVNPQMYLWHTRSFSTPKGAIQVLFEFVRPPVKIYIFGEGYDVHAVVAQAILMGWEVIIVGRKPVEILKDRFPEATECKFLMHPQDVLKHVTPDVRSAGLIMNHMFSRDQDLLHALLNSSIPYIGLLGPKERTNQMLNAENLHVPPANETLQKVFGPVGLDIGTETPEEIALSAIAEIQAVLHKRQGASLKKRESPIHNSRAPIVS
ncbi:MAG: XdhC family protein [Rhodothermales bacterium]